jgi:uncharacterized cupredoxin-like copper-binding protein
MRAKADSFLVGVMAAAAAVRGPAAAMDEHRMGGMPGMPAEMLRPAEKDLHHHYQHGDAPHEEDLRVFAFGQRGPDAQVSRVVDLEIDDSMRNTGWRPTAQRGETLRLVIKNRGKTPHEVRVGDPRYQSEHAEMLKRMPGAPHLDQNALVVPAGETRSIVWQFGDAPVVELACHAPDGSAIAVLVTILVTR